MTQWKPQTLTDLINLLYDVVLVMVQYCDLKCSVIPRLGWGTYSTVPNSIVDASTVNAFKARLDKFWSHQAVKYDFTADLTGTGNRSEEVLKSQSFY